MPSSSAAKTFETKAGEKEFFTSGVFFFFLILCPLIPRPHAIKLVKAVSSNFVYLLQNRIPKDLIGYFAVVLNDFLKTGSQNSDTIKSFGIPVQGL